MKKRLIVFFGILLLILFIGSVWFNEAVSPVNPQDTSPVIFVINQGDPIKSVASNLKKEGLIRDPLAFFILVKQKGVEKYIQAGDFRLSPSMSASEVIDELQHGTVDVWVTIPEGWRNEEIALLLARELSVPENEFLKLAEEGYMFPDTYLIPRQASASGAAELMRRNFDKKVTEPLANDIKASSLSLHEIITMASLIEREAKHDEDRPIIAGILFNRLNDNMVLNIDATLQYALGYQIAEKSWWKKSLTNEDKEVESPYNTYQFPGLPPGPIANPGLSSITAVLHPSDTEYYYYLADSEGVNHYAITLEEHNANIERYLMN